MLRRVNRDILSLLLVLSTAVHLAAQQPMLHLDFEDLPPASSTTGIIGRAFNLGPHAQQRLALRQDIPMTADQLHFSAMVWVKTFTGSEAEYQVLSSLKAVDKTFLGWEFSVQPGGAWKFDVTTADNHYEYSPSAARQSIRDGEWHLLAVTYDGNREELAFYYDGAQMARYHAPGISRFFMVPELIVGNSSRNNRTFGFLKEGWEAFNGWIDDVRLYDQVLSEAFVSSYYLKHAGIHLTPAITQEAPLPFLKVCAFNIWKGGNQLGKEVGRRRIVESLKELDADIYLIVETYGSGAVLADALGYHLYLISRNLSIISRYPIVDTYTVYEPFHSGGAKVRLPGDLMVNVFCVWLSSQPQYFIKGLTDHDRWPLEDYLREEHKTRGRDIQEILTGIQHAIDVSDRIPLIVGGDFNSGSHLDWTPQTMSSHNGYVVPWPVSLAMEKAGFTDSFRAIYPDALKMPGLTWSPTRTFPLKDRIDYIYALGKGLDAVSSEVVDHHPVGWASDHAAVVSTFRIGN